MSKKSTRATVIARVDVVYRLMLLGLNRQRIIDHVASKYPAWGSSSRSIDRYMAQAKVLLEEAGQHDRSFEFGRALARLHDLYARCVNAKDYRGAIAVQNQINDLCGLYPPRRTVVSIEDMSLSEINEEIERLEAQYAASPDA